MKKIDSFVGKHFFLSNFYECRVEVGGILYRNTEAAYQAHKCIHPEDKWAFAALSPSDAKRLGRRVRLRRDWEDIKDEVMRTVVYCKFIQNPYLAQQLLETGDAELIEGNDWGDKYWGCDIHTGEGRNQLGKILMETRAIIRERIPVKGNI